MLDINELIRSYDFSFIEITKSISLTEESYDYIRLSRDGVSVGLYHISVRHLYLNTSLWVQISRHYNMPYIGQPYDHDPTKNLFKSLFKRNMGFRIDTIE